MLLILEMKMSVPALSYHFFDLSMKNVFVCFSSMTKELKRELGQVVMYMGGACSNGLKEITTHLVTENVRADKYRGAYKHKMKVMHPKWLSEVWTMNQKFEYRFEMTNAHLDPYVLPTFHGLVMSASDLSEGYVAALQFLIETYGGTFNMTFNTENVNILLMEEDNVQSSEEMEALKKFNIRCVHPLWVTNSCSAKYAIPFSEAPDDRYIVQPQTRSEVLRTYSEFDNEAFFVCGLDSEEKVRYIVCREVATRNEINITLVHID